MGHLRRARNVQHHRNAGWPTGREPHGHGVPVVVRGGESPPQGEGGQAGRRLKGEESEMDNYLNRVDTVHWRAGCLESVPVRFGGGRLEKGCASSASPAAYPTSRPDL